MTIKTKQWFPTNVLMGCWLVLFVVGILSVSGCETAKGAQKDAQNFNLNMRTLDDWIAEHLW